MTILRYIAACLILPLALQGTARGQVPPGNFLVTKRVPTGSIQGGLLLYEPLRHTIMALDSRLLGQRQPRRAILGGGGSGSTLIAALPNAVGDEIVALTISGTAVTSVTPLSPDFLPSTIALERVPGTSVPGGITREDSILVATRGEVFKLAKATGRLNPLPLPRAATEVFVDLTHAGNLAVVLMRNLGGDGEILVFDPIPTGTLDFPHRIAVPLASAIDYDPTQNAFVVGNELGEIFLVDASRFVSQSFGIIPSFGPISNISFSPDQLNHLLGANAQLAIWDSALGSGLPQSQDGQVLDIDYNPYRETFRTFGSGCSQSRFQPLISTAGRSFPGSAFFAVTVRGAPPDATAILLLGRQQAAVPLDPIGMNGCSLLVSQILRAESCRIGFNGFAAIPLSIPPIPSLAGFRLFMQWAVFDSDANALGISTSEGGLASF